VRYFVLLGLTVSQRGELYVSCWQRIPDTEGREHVVQSRVAGTRDGGVDKTP